MKPVIVSVGKGFFLYLVPLCSVRLLFVREIDVSAEVLEVGGEYFQQ